MSTDQQEDRPEQSDAVELPPVAAKFREALPDLGFTIDEAVPDTTLTVSRDDLRRLMTVAKEDPRLHFDFLRCISGVDTYQELEAVYHLHSYKHRHDVSIKSRCSYAFPHLPTVSDIWQTANWHEREAAELFGFVFDGHPDPRPLLTEEGVDYFILRKSHPLAEMEESQEDYLRLAMEAEARTAPAETAAPTDDRAAKIAMAQKKAAVIKKAREEARAKGLPMPEEKKFVQAALKKLEQEQPAKAVETTKVSAPPQDRAAKIAMAQKKAAVIKKAREEARAKGLSMPEEKEFVQAALKKLRQEEG